MERTTKEEYFLALAEEASKRSTCIRRNYGAVIVNDSRVLSIGYNGAPEGEENCCDLDYCKRNELNIPKGERYELCRGVHAEQNAIIIPSRKEMIGATIYIAGSEAKTGEIANCEPCPICMGMIKNSGITKIVIQTNSGSKHIKIKEVD